MAVHPQSGAYNRPESVNNSGVKCVSELTLSQVEAALSGYQDPYLETDLVSANAIKDIQITWTHQHLSIRPEGGISHISVNML